MNPRVRHRLATAVFAAMGGVIGLVVAVVVTLNLHILVGLEEGYGASPAEVFEYSPLLTGLDAVLLIGAPVFVAMTVVSRRLGGDGRRDRDH